MTASTAISAPATLPVNAPGIPDELKVLPHWLCWKWEYRPDAKKQWTKPPVDAKSGKSGSSTNPATWAPFEVALDYAARHHLPGVGVVPTEDVTLLDLDNCRDADTGQISSWAMKVVNSVPAYWELSPSGSGLRGLARAMKPTGPCRKGDFEMYAGGGGRYITVTGQRLPQSAADIPESQEAVDALHAQFFPPQEERTAAHPHPVDLDDAQLLERAMNARNGTGFQRLWQGVWRAYGSQSEADLALCNCLAFWTGGDEARIDRLFRQSGLYRDKWDEKHGGQTYGKLTMRKALEGAMEFYSSDGPHNAGAPRPENLTSDYTGMLSEVRLKRVSAATLQKRALSGGVPPISKLPFLGQSEISPFISGWAHLFYGYPKTGKTELLTRMVNEWGEQGHSVLFLTEEPEMVWEARLAGLPPGFENVSLVFALGAPVQDMYSEIVDGPEDIVVVDTLRLLRLADENDNSSINISLTPIIAACRLSKKTLIMAHHTRKGSGEHGEAAAGGHAFLGIVDVAVELQRDRQATKRRILKGWGRVVEVPDIMYELQGDGSMKVLGDPGAVALDSVKAALRSCLGPGWQTTKEVREGLEDPKPSSDQVVKALTALAKEGKAERDPALSEGSKPGTTYKWRQAILTSDKPSLLSEVRMGKAVKVSGGTGEEDVLEVQ